MATKRQKSARRKREKKALARADNPAKRPATKLVGQGAQDATGRASQLRVLTAQRSEVFQGPLPAPALLEHYERVLPGLADRIVALAEAQSGHRRELESQVVKSRSRNEIAGMVLGSLIALTAIAGGIYIAGLGHDLAGYAMVVTAIGSLAGVFVYGRYEQKAELRQKREAVGTPPSAS